MTEAEPTVPHTVVREGTPVSPSTSVRVGSGRAGLILGEASRKWTSSLSETARTACRVGMRAVLCRVPPLCTWLLFKTVPALTEE